MNLLGSTEGTKRGKKRQCNVNKRQRILNQITIVMLRRNAALVRLSRAQISVDFPEADEW